MTKSSWRESMKSLESHIDPEKDEQLKKTSAEIEGKVARIMKLIKNKNQGKKAGNSTNVCELVELIQDFHNQYKALYALHDNLREKVREKVRGREYEGSSTSSSYSESYYSMDELSDRNSPRNDLQWVGDDFDLKLETSSSEWFELRNIEEKEALQTEYMVSLSKLQELEKTIKDLKTEAEQTESMKQKLSDECTQLKEKLVEREKEILSHSRKQKAREAKVQIQVKELEHQVCSLKLEQKTLRTQKRELEEQIEGRATEAKHLREENLRLEAHVFELEKMSKEREDEVSALMRKLKENESNFKSKIQSLVLQANNLQLEVNTLLAQKEKLEEQVVLKSDEARAQIKGAMMDQVNVSQQEVLENMTTDLQRMLEEKEGLERQVKDLELAVGSLCSQKFELEEKMKSKRHEADQLRLEKEGLHVRISQLEKTVMERGCEVYSVQTNFESFENDSSTQIKALRAEVKNLQQELDSLQSAKSQLELQIEREKQKSSKSLITLVEKHSMEYLQVLESKIEETVEKFCKEFEDSLHVLSCRIRVAVQLHVENKDVYRRTKQNYEKEPTDLNERITTTEVSVKRMKDISLAANDMSAGSDTAALKFDECIENLLNWISKSTCEVFYAKDWVRRKNNAMKHLQEDVDCLLAQLDTKEVEILGCREKVWKLENNVRELEKMVKEKEEGMLGLGEEKREAIRQLCVWIDYHRSRSDYLKKILSQMMAFRSKRTT